MKTEKHWKAPKRPKAEKDWRDLLSRSVASVEELQQRIPVDKREIEGVVREYPMYINPYYLSLIREKGDPLWLQAVPDKREIEDRSGWLDPLAEEAQMPAPNLIHRYPDRVLFLVSGACALYCRHCMRKRRVGRPETVNRHTIQEGLAYIEGNSAVTDVILSGGDPLLLENDELSWILRELNSISHVECVRVHTRTPCVLPQRITNKLVDVLKQYRPLFVNTHFNHPAELTSQASRACASLVEAGIPVGCQTVLLKGVNDDPAVMKALLKGLVRIRVKPYYIHHPDWVQGTGHFRVTIDKGLGVMKALVGHISGMCIPHYMIDLPGGGGKVPLVPEYVEESRDGKMQVINYAGKRYAYPLE